MTTNGNSRTHTHTHTHTPKTRPRPLPYPELGGEDVALVLGFFILSVIISPFVLDRERPVQVDVRDGAWVVFVPHPPR